MSKHIQTKQREAAERGEAIRAKSEAYAAGTAPSMTSPEWNERRRKLARKAGLKSAREWRIIAAARGTVGTEPAAIRQAREPQAVANGELRPDWKARETGRTTTRFQREQELAKSRGFRTAHEMRKARNKRSKARYSPPADEQPEPMDRFAQVPGPVRWIMRDGKPVHQPSNER